MRMCLVIALFAVLTGLKSCEALFYDLGFLFFDFEPWEGLPACIGRGTLTWKWIGKAIFA